MKLYFLSILCLSFWLFSCNQQKENPIVIEESNTNTKKLTERDISKLKFIEYGLDVKTQKVIEKWEKYNELDEEVKRIKKGDLAYFKDNDEGIKTFMKELKETMPDTINTPSVEARLTALETKLYKLESVYNLSNPSKEVLSLTVKEFLESFSNLNLQMNKKLEKESQNIEKP